MTTTASPAFTAAEFYRHLAEGNLMASRCKACGSLHLPPRPLCGHCYVRDMEWFELHKRGKLAAFTIIAVAPSAMLKEGLDRTNPYCSGIVALEGGLRLSARILGVDAQKPESIAIGTVVALEVLRDADGRAKPIVAFRTVPAT